MQQHFRNPRVSSSFIPAEEEPAMAEQAVDRELKNAPARPKYKGIQKLLEHGYTPSTRVHVDLQLQPVDSNVISTAEGVL